MEQIQFSQFGKTSPEPSVPTKEKTSESSSKNSAKLKTVTPMFLDLTKANGLTREKSWETGTLSHGGSWTRNTGAYPKDVEESFLWQILEGGGAGKVLFEREGLSRDFAESRESWQGITRSLAFRSGVKSGESYCLQGNGIDRSDNSGCNGRGWAKDLSYTLNTTDRPATAYIKEEESIHKEYGISSYHPNSMKSDNPHSGIYIATTARTLDLNGGNPACNQGGIVLLRAYPIENHPADSRVDIDEEGLCQALTSRMGTGGGNVPMCLCVRERCGCDGGGQGTLDTE